MPRKLSLLLWCAALALLSFVILDFWHSRNAPAFKKFERLWSDDLELLEKSGKLPPGWFDVKEVEIIGGTPETKRLLKRIQVPISSKNPEGKHRIEVLLVLWEEGGKLGVTIQYNLSQIETRNQVLELGRTLILNKSDLIMDLKSLFGEGS